MARSGGHNAVKEGQGEGINPDSGLKPAGMTDFCKRPRGNLFSGGSDADRGAVHSAGTQASA